MRSGFFFGAVFFALGATTFARAAHAADAAHTTDDDLPKPPPVSDPMLANVAPAPRQIASLHEAIDLVRARSADLRTAMLEVMRAEAQTRSALAALLPQINASGSLTHQLLTDTITSVNPATGASTTTTSPAENSASANVTLQQSVFNLPLIRAHKTAKINEEVQILQLEDEKRVLLSGVVTNIVGVVAAEKAADLNRVGLKAALERLEIVKTKERLGSATTLDIRRGEQDVETARATLVTGDETLRQAREALALSLGLTGQIGVDSALDFATLESDSVSTCGAIQKVENRPDILAADRNLEIKVRAIDDAWSQFLPTLTFQSVFSPATSTVVNAPPSTWSLTGVLSVPIWDGGNRYGLIHQAEASAQESRWQLEATKRQLTTLAEQNRRAIDVAVESRVVADRAQKLAAEIDKLVQVTYRMGQGTSLDLVTAATAKRQADINLVLADFAVAKAKLVDKLTLAACKY